MKKQRMTTEAKSFGLLKIAIVLVMLAAMVCCLTVATAAAMPEELEFTIAGTKVVGNETLTMVYGDTVEVTSDEYEITNVTVPTAVGDQTIVVDYAKDGVAGSVAVAVKVAPKTLTWAGNASVNAVYGTANVTVATLPALEGVLAGDTVTAVISNGVISLADLNAGTYTKAIAVALAGEDSANYVVAAPAVDVTVAPVQIVALNGFGEKTFQWGEAVQFNVAAVDANGKTYPVVVTYDKAANTLGDYVYSVAAMDGNISLAGLTVEANYHIVKKQYEVDLKIDVLSAGVITPTVSVEGLPSALAAQIKYSYAFVEAASAFGPYTYAVSVTLPAATANYEFLDTKGNVVTSLTTEVVVSHGNVALGTNDQPALIVLFSPSGYLGEVSATLAIPSDADFAKAIKGFRYHSEYTVSVKGAAGETFSVMIPVDASLVNRHCTFASKDIYLYDATTKELVSLRDTDYNVTWKDGYYVVDGIAGDSTVTFVVSPEYNPPILWVVLIICFVIIALIVAMFLIGLYLRRKSQDATEEIVIDTEGDVPAVVVEEAPELVDLEEKTEEQLEEKEAELADTDATEPEVDETEVDGAKDDAMGALMEDVQAIELEAPAAEEAVEVPAEEAVVEVIAVVGEEDEDDGEAEGEEEDDSFAFGDMDLDFFDAVENADRYAELLEKESRGEVRIVTRYRRSFQSRVIQSQGNVQDYYSEIKNALLAYKGVKSRVSWNYDAFNRGRTQVAKITAKTKTLYLYLAIEPSSLEESKYSFVDVSSKKKYAMVPVLMKIKGERKFKHALELIDKICAENLQLQKMDVEPIDYRVPYATTEELVSAGVVKKMVASVPVVYGETAVSETPVEAVAPATEEQEVSFVAPADAPAVEEASEN